MAPITTTSSMSLESSRSFRCDLLRKKEPSRPPESKPAHQSARSLRSPPTPHGSGSYVVHRIHMYSDNVRAGVKHNNIRLEALKRRHHFVTPHGIAYHASGFLTLGLKNHTHDFTERLGQFRNGIQGIKAEL